MVFKKILEKVASLGGNTAYYPGCLTKFAGKRIEENYKKILTKLGIEYIMLPEFRCCGNPVLAAGYKKDYDKLLSENKAIFKKYSIKRIITNCPTCYRVFRDEYQLKGIEVLHMTQVLDRHLSQIEKKHDKEKICYHDPCHLGRHGGVYNEPRRVLRQAGFTVLELPDCKEDSMCCGGGGGLSSNDHALAQKIAKIRLAQCSTSQIVTPCPMCYKNLKEASRGSGITVYELSEVLL